MKTIKISFGILMLILVMSLSGCGKNKSSFAAPDPEKHFEGCDISTISEDNGIVCYEGFEIRSDDMETLKSLYKEYIELCKKDPRWSINVYSSEIYWAHKNKEGTKQLTANYDPDNGLIRIFIKDIKEEEK